VLIAAQEKMKPSEKGRGSRAGKASLSNKLISTWFREAEARNTTVLQLETGANFYKIRSRLINELLAL